MKRQLVTVLIVGTLLSACDDGKSNPSTPTAPSLQTTAFPRTVVAAAAVKTVGIAQPSTCFFDVRYDWSGLGGGADDQAQIVLRTVNAGVIDHHSKVPVSGQGGSFSTSFAVTGHASPDGYFAEAYLFNLHSFKNVHNSLIESSDTLTATCS